MPPSERAALSLSEAIVQGYCEWLFKRAGLDSFDWWWVGGDPVLDERSPQVVAPSMVWIAWGVKHGDTSDETVLLGVFAARDRAESECERREAEFDDDSVSEHEVQP